MSDNKIEEIEARALIKQSERIVVKIGSSLLANFSKGIDLEKISSFAGQTAKLIKAGKSVVLVSSGAVAAGAVRLGMESRPEGLQLLQAAAAVGQCKLMRYYSEAFAKYNIPVGQMLLTRDGFDFRERYLNARNTLNALLEQGGVPVINENDTVMVEEIQFGDNDQLSSMVAPMADADLLIILSDIDGLHEKPPAEGESPVISFVPEITADIEALAGISNSTVSRGGMASKLDAAKRATSNGVNVVIASGSEENILEKILSGEIIGTLFTAADAGRSARKKWLSNLHPMGKLIVDDGAVSALAVDGKSLLAIGIRGADGSFNVGDAVEIASHSGERVAIGLSNFSVSQVERIKGLSNADVSDIFGKSCANTVVHRDNMVIVATV